MPSTPILSRDKLRTPTQHTMKTSVSHILWCLVTSSIWSSKTLVNALVPGTRNYSITRPPKSVLSHRTASTERWMNQGSPELNGATLSVSLVPSRVAVSGATGRTGSLVVDELLARNISVVAMVRSMDKAQEVLVSAPTKSGRLTICSVDLTSQSQVQEVLEGCDAVVWCATGFSDAPQSSWLQKIKRVLGMALAPKQQSIDIVGLPLVAQAMLNQRRPAIGPTSADQKKLPQVVMLSSAGVTRLSWTDAKKKKLEGCADIPIVRLNPFGILNIKAESEQALRESGVNYCIVRPTGLNDNWPSGSRPIFSQGDVAVGRIHRRDVAKVMCDVLNTPHACQKTFEVLSLAGYPPPRSMEPILERLVSDTQGLTEDQVEANFALLQQLLPGEVQDAAKLAMGQTYEQLDAGKTGRLGERGKEDAEAAAPKPTTNGQ